MWFIFFTVLMVLLANKLTEEKTKELTIEQKNNAWKKSVGWRE